MARPPLSYEYATSPEPGCVIEIHPGILWLRMPLPFMLGHINLWLLADGDRWAIVDTGLYTEKTRELWSRVVAEQMGGGLISRVLVTHLHPDHVGCAGWLCERYDTGLWMSREEYLLCRILVADTGLPAPPEGIRFYSETGFPESAIERYENSFGRFGSVVAPLPRGHHRLKQGDSLEIGNHTWRIIIGRGHSVEHACLYCEQLGMLISGDQVLPTISSNVSVYPTEPQANPLHDWLESLQSLRESLPADTLVLPAHGRPFRGLHQRLDELRDEHLDGLQKLQQLCQKPQRAIDTFPALFKSSIDENNLLMAAGEAVAHLNYLQFAGEMKSWRDADGVRWYQSVLGL